MRRFLQVLGRVLRVGLIALLILVAVVAVALGGLFLVGRSHWGQQKLLAAVLPLIRPQLAGELRVAELTTDLTHMLVLRDVELTDSEGQVAVRAARIGLRYNLLALLIRKVDITAMHIEGAAVHGRRLTDGSLNLARLLKKSNKPPSNTPIPVAVQISGITVDAELDDEVLPQPIKPARAQAHVEGEVVLQRGTALAIAVRLTALKLALSEPVVGQLSAVGQLTLDGKGLVVHDLQIQLGTSGAQVSRLVPVAQVRGPLSLHMQVSGSPAELVADAQLVLPQGRAHVHGTLGPTVPGLPWRGTVELTDVGLQAVRADLPPVTVQLALAASGEGPRGRVELRGLDVSGLSARVLASGFIAGDLRQPEPEQAEADVKFTATATDLGQLRELGVADLLGEAQLGGRVQLHDHKAVIDLDATGKRFSVGPVQAQKLHLQLHTPDLVTGHGQLMLAGSQVVVSGQRFDEIKAQAQGGPTALSLQVSGRAAPAIEFSLDLDAKPTWHGPELLAVAATIKGLHVRKADQLLQLVRPAQVALSLTGPAAPVLVASDVHVAVGEQLIFVSGRFEGGTTSIDAKLDAKAIDARRWTTLLGIAESVPSTKLDAHLELRGPLRAPDGRIELSGTTQALAEPHLPATTLALHAELSSRRIKGETSVALGDAAIRDQPKLTARFDLPLLVSGPLSLQVQASAQVEQLADYLPPTLPVVHALKAALALTGGVKGTIERPEAELTLTAPSWQLGALRGVQTAVGVSYSGQAQRLAVTVAGKLQNAGAELLGSVAASAQAPLHLRMDTALPMLSAQLRAAPLLAEVKVTEVQLPTTLRLAMPAREPLLRAGTLNAALTLKGRAMAPEIALQGKFNGLAAGPLHDVGVDFTGSYVGSDVKVELQAALLQKPLLSAQGRTRVELAKLLAAPLPVLQALPLSASAQVLPFDLQGVSPLLHGMVVAQLDCDGTPTAPLLTAQLRATDVQLDTWRVGTLNADASLDLKRQLQATVQVQQGGPATPGQTTAGMLSLRASVPLAQIATLADATPTLLLRANHFRIDYAPAAPGESEVGHVSDNEPLLGDLRRARATLDADAEIVLGATTTLHGFVKVTDGEFFHKALPQELREITLEVQLQPEGHLRLVQLAAKAGVGAVQVEGTAHLDNGKLAEAELTLAAKQFPVAAGSIGALIDTHIRAKAKSQADTLHVDVVIPDGTVRLPKLSSSRELQSLDPLSDVKFIDRAAQEQAARLRALQEAKDRERAAQANKTQAPVPLLPAKLLVNVRLPGPLSVDGPEVKTDLQGHLEVRIEPPNLDGPIVTGELTSLGGWVEVLGRRYQLARAEVSLSGETPPNPLLDVVISRQLDTATISIIVSGTASKPKISFRSDPPLYDDSQIIAILLSGESGGNISSQALGALSSILVGSIKEQLGSLLPIDVIKLDVSGSDPMGLGSSSLEIGKYLRDNLYFSYMHRFGSATTGLRRLNIEQVRLEYRFLSRFQLTTRYGDAQVGSLDLDWTKRF